MGRSHAALSRFTVCAALLCAGAFVSPATAGRTRGFSTIDVPGSSFTSATGINPQGHIVGQYDDAAGRRLGFLLAHRAFTTIDYPDAVSTGAFGINPKGDIVGNYQDSAGVRHGFILSDGVFTSYDFPQAVNGTFIHGITPKGTIVGEFKTTQLIGQFGFAFRYDGTSHQQLVPPGSRQAIAWAINPAGEIAGAYVDSANQTHGWVLDRHDTWWTIDFPGATLTNARGINSAGEVVGVYRVGSPQAPAHGYLLSRGTFSTIDYPGSNTTRALGISATGDIVGDYTMPGDPRTHAFVLVR
jgi:uncharacterized membrane protein